MELYMHWDVNVKPLYAAKIFRNEAGFTEQCQQFCDKREQDLIHIAISQFQ